MFCEKCGCQLPDTAEFCWRCGMPFSHSENKTIDSEEVLMKIKPTYKLSYSVIPALLLEILICSPCFILLIAAVINKIQKTNMHNIDFNDIYAPIAVIFMIFIPMIAIIVSKAIFEKKQFERAFFLFYHNKLVYNAGCENGTEQELEYKEITQISKAQTFIQKYYGLGTIYLYTDEGRKKSGVIILKSIKNVDIIYNKIKEIIKV